MDLADKILTILTGDQRVRVSTMGGDILGWIVDGKFVSIISEADTDDMVRRTIAARKKPQPE